MIQPKNVPIGKTSYKLTEDFVYKMNHFVYKIEKGFVWDGASLSPMFAWFMRRDGICRAASCIHDYLYTHGYLNFTRISDHSWIYETQIKYTRHKADKLFRDILIESGYPKWKANIAYRGVRIFGGSYWGKK